MTYKDKLKAWNSTDKYQKELDFLERIMPFNWEYCSSCLDIGCGIGTATKYFDCAGYDVNDYFIGDYYEREDYHLNVLPDGSFDHVYFFHSLAHIPNPKELLETLKSKYSGSVFTVITPNAEWLDKDYVGDETVIKHFTQQELCTLFIESGYTIQLVGQFGEYKNGTNERIFLQATV